MHPSRWLGDRWHELLKILASPLSKPVAAAVHAMWDPAKPGDITRRYQNKIREALPVAYNSGVDYLQRNR